MAKHPKLLWIVVLLLGWTFDFLFWGKTVGINFAFFVAISVLGGFFLLLANGIKPAREKPLAAHTIRVLHRHHRCTPGTTDAFPRLYLCAGLDGFAGSHLSGRALASIQFIGLLL